MVDIRVWKTLQRLVLVGFVAAVVLLPLVDPLWVRRFWVGFVPLLPLVFLLTPALWRNVCPLATLGAGGPVSASSTSQARTSLLPPILPGVLALFLLIPLRAAFFETSGVATAGLLAGIGGVAFWQGRKSPGKSGFCNRLCPILPVERIYGQSPLVGVGNARCGPCDMCGPRGCVDLNPRSALPQVLGTSRHGHGWLASPLGAFAAALPGVVWAFSRLHLSTGDPSMRLAQALGVILLGASLSWLTAGVIIRALDLGWRVAVPSLAAAAAALHLWTTIPAALGAWSLSAAPTPLQWVAMGFVGAWWLRALDSPRRARLVQLSRNQAGTR